MLQLRDQSASLIQKLATISGLNQVEFIEFKESLEFERPKVLPCAQLLYEADFINPQNKLADVEATWTVLITSKNMMGTLGQMNLIDSVLDALTGFQPNGAIRPLVPKKIQPIDVNGDVPSYAIIFTTVQRASINWIIRNN